MPSSLSLTEEEAYRTLEIKLGASENEIKAAYRKLALKTHPDKNPNDLSANKRFLLVSEAYKRLTDEDFSDDDDYEDYDDDDEDFDISEIFAFKMFERMFYDGVNGVNGVNVNVNVSGGGIKRGNGSGGNGRANGVGGTSTNGGNNNGNNNGNGSNNNGNGGVQFSFPGMVGGGGGCNCPDCRRRFGYEKTKPWREYIPKSQRTDIPKETVKEVDPSIHDNWLSDEEDRPKTNTKGTTKAKSKKALKRENAAKEQRAHLERLGKRNVKFITVLLYYCRVTHACIHSFFPALAHLLDKEDAKILFFILIIVPSSLILERQARDSHCNDHSNHHHHNSHHHQHHHDTTTEESHMHMNKVHKLKMKQEEERLKLEQEKANKVANLKKKGHKESENVNQKSKKKLDNDKEKQQKNAPAHSSARNSDDEDSDDSDDDSDLDIEEMASRMGITDHSGNKSSKQGSSGKGSKTATNLDQTTGKSADFTTKSVPNTNHKYKVQIAALQEMGFDYGPCVRAIETSFGSVELAATMLLQSQCPEEDSIPAPTPPPAPRTVPTKTVPTSTAASGATTNTNAKPQSQATRVATTSIGPTTSIAPGLGTKNMSTPINLKTTGTHVNNNLHVNKVGTKQSIASGLSGVPTVSYASAAGVGSYLAASNGGGKKAIDSPTIGMPAQKSSPNMPPGLSNTSGLKASPSSQQQNVSSEKVQHFKMFNNQESKSPQSSTFSMPSQSMPMQQMPSLSMPTQSMPKQTMPSLSMPNQSVPSLPKQTMPNLTMPSQSMPSQTMPSQSMPGQSMPSQTLPNQSISSQVMPDQSIPMPISMNDQTQSSQSTILSSTTQSSKFFSMFSSQDREVDSLGNNQVGTFADSLGSSGLGLSVHDIGINMSHENDSGESFGLGSSLSDLLLNSDSRNSSGSILGNNGAGNEGVSSIFDTVMADDSGDMGLGLGIGGLNCNNSSSTSLSCLLIGEQESHLDVSQGLHSHNAESAMLGSILDMSSLIGSENESSSMETMLGSSLLMDPDPTESILSEPYHSPATMSHPSNSNMTAAAIVKNGKPSPNNGVGQFSSGASPPGMTLPKQTPTSPVSHTSVSSSAPSATPIGSTKCLYFYTARGCRHGSNCKFSHSAGAVESSNNTFKSQHHLANRSNGNSSAGGVGSMTLSKKPCMFYSSPQGCKHGSACRFVHSNKHK
jgi:curved DNA-binding protein CbpA